MFTAITMYLYLLTIYVLYHRYNLIEIKENYYQFKLDLKKNRSHYPINPSILYVNRNLAWGSVRYTNDHKCDKKILKEYTSDVHVLNSNFETEHIVNIDNLTWCNHVTFRRKGCEDPRSFSWNNNRFLLLSVVGINPYPCNNKQYLYNVDTKEYNKIVSPFENNTIEKNWLPFIYDRHLYIEYLINPRKIFKYNDSCIIEESFCKSMSSFLHGSVSSVLYNNNYYIGMGHTHPNYEHIFYIYENKPPFKIIRFSDEIKLHNNYSKQYEFITGMSILDDNIYISYSVNDCINYITKIPILYLDKMISNYC